MIEIKSASEENASVELFIDGKSMGIFPTAKRANIFVANSSNAIIVNTERSGVSQKNDEPTLNKRRGRPKKADNDRRKFPSICKTDV